MKATESKIEDFLSSTKTQFIIPVYQRNYDWSTVQCQQLLEDILKAGASESIQAHFIGSIVYIHDNVYTTSKIKKLMVIDGQQRLTTLTLIYIAIKKLALSLGNHQLKAEIEETYLINKFAPEAEKLKLRPTENNDKALQYLLKKDSTETFGEFSRLIDNFNFIKERIVKENYLVFQRGLSKLMFVEVSLEKDKDNPQRIFESLNSTGLELTQADLIRNYILMGLDSVSQKEIYQNYWEPIERLAKDQTSNSSKVSEFIRDYLTLVNREIPTKKGVYDTFKLKYQITAVEELENNLSELKTFAIHYNKLLNPDQEGDPKIRERLHQINKLEINVCYPFLMKVYRDYSETKISDKTFEDVLDLVQAFTFRRFIAGLPTNALNKIFMNLYEKVDSTNYLRSLQKSLMERKGTQRFPKNTEVAEALRTRDMYHINSKNRSYLLERLENYDNPEPVVIEGNYQITVEHIFPQNPDPLWKIELGEDEYNDIKTNYLNTLANLTLSGNNGKLGNKPFLQKRDLPKAGYRESHLWLNQYLANLETWDKDEIKKRSKILEKRFFRIWQLPEISIDDEQSEEVNIFDAEDPTGKKLEYAILFDQKLELYTVSKLYEEAIKKLFEIQPETFFTTNLAQKLSLTENPKNGTPISPLKISETYFIENNLNSTAKFDRIKMVLSALNCEDELYIKYAK